jgi:hypothetical protein
VGATATHALACAQQQRDARVHARCSACTTLPRAAAHAPHCHAHTTTTATTTAATTATATATTAGGNMVAYVTKRRETREQRGGLCLDEDEANYFFRQLIRAVQFCHNNHVAHRCGQHALESMRSWSRCVRRLVCVCAPRARHTHTHTHARTHTET